MIWGTKCHCGGSSAFRNRYWICERCACLADLGRWTLEPSSTCEEGNRG